MNSKIAGRMLGCRSVWKRRQRGRGRKREELQKGQKRRVSFSREEDTGGEIPSTDVGTSQPGVCCQLPTKWPWAGDLSMLPDIVINNKCINICKKCLEQWVAKGSMSMFGKYILLIQLVCIQVVPNLGWFGSRFFNCMILWKWSTFSRNYTLNIEFCSFRGLVTCNMKLSGDAGSSTIAPNQSRDPWGISDSLKCAVLLSYDVWLLRCIQCTFWLWYFQFRWFITQDMYGHMYVGKCGWVNARLHPRLLVFSPRTTLLCLQWLSLITDCQSLLKD